MPNKYLAKKANREKRWSGNWHKCPGFQEDLQSTEGTKRGGGGGGTKSHLNYYCKILRRPFSQFCTAGLTEPSRKLTIALVAGDGDGGSKVPKSRFAVLTALPHEGNRIPVPR